MIDIIKWIGIVVGVLCLANLLGVAALGLWVRWKEKCQERENPLHAVNNHFATEEQISMEEAAIVTARRVLQQR